jgi:hypothetical protein
LCKQKCSQCLVQITKRGDLKDLLEGWKIIQILNPALNNVLHSVVEKGILECLNCEAKLQTYDKHSNDFIDQVLDGPLLDSFTSCSKMFSNFVFDVSRYKSIQESELPTTFCTIPIKKSS